MQYFSTRFDFLGLIVLMKLIFLSFRIYVTPVSTVRPASMDLQIRNKFPYVQWVTRGNNVKKITVSCGIQTIVTQTIWKE